MVDLKAGRKQLEAANNAVAEIFGKELANYSIEEVVEAGIGVSRDGIYKKYPCAAGNPMVVESVLLMYKLTVFNFMKTYIPSVNLKDKLSQSNDLSAEAEYLFEEKLKDIFVIAAESAKETFDQLYGQGTSGG